MASSWRVDATASPTVESMIIGLAGMCDGAHAIDGAGFNRLDTAFGHSLAQQARQGKAWSDKQAEAALKLIQKYQGQLGGKNYISSWLKTPVFRNQPISKAVPNVNLGTGTRTDRKLTSIGSDAIFTFGYDTKILADIKTIRGVHQGKKFWASWNPEKKFWSIPVNETSINLIMSVAIAHNFTIEQRFTDYVQKVRAKTMESNTYLVLSEANPVSISGGMLVIAVNNAAILEEFEKELEGI